MVDGTTEVLDIELTENNRSTIKAFVEEVLIQGQLDKMSDYIVQEHYQEHSPSFSDELDGLHEALSNSNDVKSINYEKCHRLLAEGNFVLSVSEGSFNKTPYSFFDLYRLDNGKIIEHWGTSEAIPEKDKWKNNNGKF